MQPARFDTFLVALDPTVGREIQKTRPCVVVTPDEMNRHLQTVIVAPMTTRGITCRTRVPCEFAGRSGHIALDQLRTVDRKRLVRRLGRIDKATQVRVLEVLSAMFAL